MIPIFGSLHLISLSVTQGSLFSRTGTAGFLFLDEIVIFCMEVLTAPP